MRTPTTGLPATLANVMAEKDYSPSCKIYVEKHLPSWTPVVFTDRELYTSIVNPLGHDAKVYTYGTTTYILRARSGSRASPTNGVLYFAALSGAMLNTPEDWEGEWTVVDLDGNDGPMRPHATSDTGAASVAGQIAIGCTDSNRYVRIFYVNSSYQVTIVTLDAANSFAVSSIVPAATLDLTLSSTCCQIAAASPTMAFFVDTLVVPHPRGSNRPNLSLSTIGILYYEGTWKKKSAYQTQKACTMTGTNPATECVVTCSGHGLSDDNSFEFLSTGQTPAGVSTGLTYYVNYINSSTFNFALTADGANIYSGLWQSGTHYIRYPSPAPYTWPLADTYVFGRMVPEEDTRIDATPGSTVNIWGPPSWGGLGAVQITESLTSHPGYLVSVAGFELDALPYAGDLNGVFSFQWDAQESSGALVTDQGWWVNSPVFQGDYSAKDEGYRYFNSMARLTKIGNRYFCTWLHEEESTDLTQTVNYEGIPRRREIVYSYSEDGTYWTEPQAIVTDHATYTPRMVGSGPVLLVDTTACPDTLYMISWQDVIRGNATHIALGEDHSGVQTDISDIVNSWSVTQTGRRPDTSITLGISNLTTDDERDLFVPNSLITVKAGAVVGTTPTTITIAKGFLDTADLTGSAEQGVYEGSVTALPAKPLQDTYLQANFDILPQAQTYIAPSNIDQWAIVSGNWRIEQTPDWATHADLENILGPSGHNMICIDSHDIPTHQWHQMAFFTHPADSDVTIESSVRMGSRFKSIGGTGIWGCGVQDFNFSLYDSNGWRWMIHNGYLNGYAWRWSARPYVDGEGNPPGSDPPTSIWSDAYFRKFPGWNVQGYSAVGIAARAQSGESGYVFAWEAGLPEWTYDDTMNFPDDRDRIDMGVPTWPYRPGLGPSSLSNYLVLYFFDNYDAEDGNGPVIYRRLAATALQGYPDGDDNIKIGYPLKLQMSINRRYISCRYMTWNSSSKLWSGTWITPIRVQNAFYHNCGSVGFYGRGFLGGRGYANQAQHTNGAWIWDTRIYSRSDTNTSAEVIKLASWKASVPAVIKDREKIADTVPPGYTTWNASSLTHVLYDTTAAKPYWAVNPVIDMVATASLVSTGYGFVIRSTADHASYVRAGVVYDGSPAQHRFRVVGVGTGTNTVDTTIPYTPVGTGLRLRLVISNEWYSLYYGNELLGTLYVPFKTDIGLGGVQVGYYYTTSSPNLTVHSFQMSELGDVPLAATLDSGASMLENITRFIGQRRLRMYMDYAGNLRIGTYKARSSAATFNNTMFSTATHTQDRGITVCRVVGAQGWATYKSPLLTTLGRYFREVSMPDLMTQADMYREAEAIVRESQEMRVQCNFEGYPNLAVEPEDIVEIIDDIHDISGDFIVDDVTYIWSPGGFLQQIGTRQVYTE